MPANMMSDPAGSILNVTGRSRATVRAGPMPGRTPTAVPRKTPIRANRSFVGSKATRKPCPSAAKASMSEPQQPLERPFRQRQSQEPRESEIDQDADDEADHEV